MDIVDYHPYAGNEIVVNIKRMEKGIERRTHVRYTVLHIGQLTCETIVRKKKVRKVVRSQEVRRHFSLLGPHSSNKI